MSEKCVNKVPCGCGDTPLETKPPCNIIEECESTVCPEQFCTECIVDCNTGITPVDPGDPPDYDPIIDIDPEMGASTLDNQLETLRAFIQTKEHGAKIAIGLKITKITDTAVSVKWIGKKTVSNYKVSVSKTLRHADGFYSIAFRGSNKHTFKNLTPQTVYYVRILTEQPIKGGSVYSSKILTFKTK